MKLDKLAKKAKLDENVVLYAIYDHHLRESKLLKKKDLKTVDITYRGDAFNRLLKASKVLKVSIDSIVNAILRDQINKMKEENHDSK